mmetsp:Transcript_47077/g.100091  ORF Transcript_47077/g.100091 Transcript_47077/m.100091 type:complete len:209 (+) Transcript_47077:284-910(+)
MNPLPTFIVIVLIFLSAATVAPSASSSSSSSSNSPASGSGSRDHEPRCISVDSYHTYICTDDPEASRRAVASSVGGGDSDKASSSSSSSLGSGGGGGGDGASGASSSSGHSTESSPFDMDLGVEQRITGSETEQLRIRNVLRKMYAYFEEEVLTRSEYEHVRGRCKNVHELCAFWTSVSECESNRGFMLENCAAACRLCLLANTNMMA